MGRKLEEKGGLPHLWIALDGGLPLQLMKKLQTMLSVLPVDHVHLYLLSPAEIYWGDMKTGKYRSSEDEVKESAGPLMRAFGRKAQDLHNQSVDGWFGEGGGELNSEPDALPETLLGRLQERCRFPGEGEVSPPVSVDGTFEVHACRSPFRELEVCRDRILQCLAEDKSLMPEEILLLYGGPGHIKHYVGAALQPQEEIGQRIPFRLVAAGENLASSLEDGLLRLLDSLKGRFDQESLLALMEHPLVIEKFKFGNRVHDMFSWLQDAGYRWGLDEQHRRDIQGVEEDRWSLWYALKRLSLGAVVSPDQRNGLVDGDAPLERVGGLEVSELAKLTMFSGKLSEAKGRFREDEPCDMGEWVRKVSWAIDAFFGVGSPDQQKIRFELIQTTLPEMEKQSPKGMLMTFGALMRMLGDKLSSSSSAHHGGKGGGVTVAPLGHYAGTPAKVVLVTGLGQEHFPHREDRAGWHPLATNRKWGDPDPRDDDRHRLLMCLLSAGQKLILTYEGGSDEDDRERPPSTPISDLLNAAGECCQDDPSSYHFTGGLLNGFSPPAHYSSNLSRRSLLHSDLEGAKTLQGTNAKPFSGLWSEGLPREVDSPRVSRKDLKDLVQMPTRVFLKRLGIRPPDEEDELVKGELLELNHLEQYGLRNQLLLSRLNGEADDSVYSRFERSGELPPGKKGEMLWDQIELMVPKIPVGNWTGHHLNGDLHVLEVNGVSRDLEMGLDLEWYRLEGHGPYFHWMEKGWKASDRLDKLLRVQIDLLMLSLAEGEVHATVKGMENVKGAYKEVQMDFSIQKPELVAPLMSELLLLFDLARSVPIPINDQLYRMMAGEGSKKKYKGKEAPDESLLELAEVEWFGGAYSQGGIPSASERPENRMIFRGLDHPALWKGPSGMDLKPFAPSLSLALSAYKWLRDWQKKCEGVIVQGEAC